jgi:hypothetical protein
MKCLCRCSCGVEREVWRGSLLNVRSVSCGCFSAESAANRRKAIALAPPEKKVRRQQSYSKYTAASIAELGDWYLKSLMARRGGVAFKDIPESLVELKREQLSLQRLAKRMTQAATEAKEQQ